MRSGAPWNSHGGPEASWRRFGQHPGVGRLCFSKGFMERRGRAVLLPLSSGCATYAGPGVQVGGMWAHKSHPNVLVSKGLFYFVRSMRGALSELWKLLANCRNSPQIQVQADFKVHLSHQTQD